MANLINAVGKIINYNTRVLSKHLIIRSTIEFIANFAIITSRKEFSTLEAGDQMME